MSASPNATYGQSRRAHPRVVYCRRTIEHRTKRVVNPGVQELLDLAAYAIDKWKKLSREFAGS